MKGSYEHHKMIKAAQGVKISAQNLETAVAGTQLLVVGEDDDVETLKLEVVQDMKNIFSSVDRSGELFRQAAASALHYQASSTNSPELHLPEHAEDNTVHY